MKENSEQTRIGSAFGKLVKQLGEPVDFELPKWFTKSKPMQYTYIKRNIYLSKRRFEDNGIFCSCTPSPESSSVCGIDCHCGVILSSCSSSCKCGNSCMNKPFQHRPVKKTKLVQTEKCGYGIVADEDIKLGDFVIEYVGEGDNQSYIYINLFFQNMLMDFTFVPVIDDRACEERLWDMKHREETNFYLCEINRNMVIDATNKGNKSRYINHSCCPNTEMQKWLSADCFLFMITDGETRLGIFATHDIQKGEPLTYDYRFVPFGADQDCHCGAVGCGRKLGVKPGKPKMSSDAPL
ncbi:PREDICTED: histone-lysine N-methyltransferase ASHH3-like [Lupinus angustifolius]|uniref:histone-lysine N-methyltransferase ASHH3-like n=1 Tax=Lupinus angustifolius TaxID=3871 RepID=UPI00092FCED4|nr:PREDICTED: histone-lysine N-methyltransferase ASHH3-like [Lupinus angustifolius]